MGKCPFLDRSRKGWDKSTTPGSCISLSYYKKSCYRGNCISWDWSKGQHSLQERELQSYQSCQLTPTPSRSQRDHSITNTDMAGVEETLEHCTRQQRRQRIHLATISLMTWLEGCLEQSTFDGASGGGRWGMWTTVHHHRNWANPVLCAGSHLFHEAPTQWFQQESQVNPASHRGLIPIATSAQIIGLPPPPVIRTTNTMILNLQFPRPPQFATICASRSHPRSSPSLPKRGQ